MEPSKVSLKLLRVAYNTAFTIYELHVKHSWEDSYSRHSMVGWEQKATGRSSTDVTLNNFYIALAESFEGVKPSPTGPLTDIVGKPSGGGINNGDL